MEFVKKYKKYISYSLWAIFLVLAFKGLANNLLVFFMAIAQISLNIICGDFKFNEVNKRLRDNFGDSSEGGTRGGGASNITSLESNGLKKGQNWNDED